jgi:hypothetical protein
MRGPVTVQRGLEGTMGVLMGYSYQGYSQGTRGVLIGYSHGTHREPAVGPAAQPGGRRRRSRVLRGGRRRRAGAKRAFLWACGRARFLHAWVCLCTSVRGGDLRVLPFVRTRASRTPRRRFALACACVFVCCVSACYLLLHGCAAVRRRSRSRTHRPPREWMDVGSRRGSRRGTHQGYSHGYSQGTHTVL